MLTINIPPWLGTEVQVELGRRGIKKRTISKKAGVDQSLISMWLQGMRSSDQVVEAIRSLLPEFYNTHCQIFYKSATDCQQSDKAVDDCDSGPGEQP